MAVHLRDYASLTPRRDARRHGRRLPGDWPRGPGGAGAGARGSRVRLSRMEPREGIQRPGDGVRIGGARPSVSFWRAAMTEPLNLPRVAVVSDLREERWHAMDLVAEMLLLNLRTPGARLVDAMELRPAMVRRLTRLPLVGVTATAETADRILNRVWDYPRWLRPPVRRLRSLPHRRPQLRASGAPAASGPVDRHVPRSGRVPRRASRVRGGSVVERALGRRLLAGMRSARKILCGSAATRDALVSASAIPAERIVVVPYGVHPCVRPSTGSGGGSRSRVAARSARRPSARAAARRQHDCAQAHRRAAARRRGVAREGSARSADPGRRPVHDQPAAACRPAWPGRPRDGAALRRSARAGGRLSTRGAVAADL